MNYEQKTIPVTKLVTNSGQLAGVPKNPRLIRDARFEALKKSILDTPEMLYLREMIVVPYGNKFVVLCGNQRFRACKDLGYKEIFCKVIPADTPIARMRKYAMKDNIAFGYDDSDAIEEDWQEEELTDCGFEFEKPKKKPKKEQTQEEEVEDDGKVDVSLFKSMLEDCIYPSDNLFDIPVLDKNEQAGRLVLPLAPYGADSRLRKDIGTYHFYVEDYRFEAIWKDPIKVLASGCHAVVEPNLSLFDTTPIAYGLQQIYKKRWIARYFQECGIKVYADLNVSPKFYEFNLMGIPEGYNAFFTRGYTDRIDRLELEIQQAKDISGLDCPNLIIYGGGKKVKDVAIAHNLVYVEQFMQRKGNG